MPAIDYDYEDQDEVVRFHEMALRLAKNRGSGGRLALYPGDDGVATGPSAGETFTKSRAYKEWLGRFKDGGPTAPGNYSSDPVEVKARALITSADASAGSWVGAEHLGLLESGRVRPLSLRQLVTIVGTKSDSIEYASEVSRVAAAAPVDEATALTGTSGTKPEGGIVFELKTAVVRTFAVWAPATKRILSDAPQLRDYIDRYLSQDLGEEVEDQMTTGNGAGQNFLGILNTPGIQTAGPPGAGQSMLHSLRTGRRLVVANGRAIPTAVLMNPVDAESLDLIEINGEDNHFVGAGPYAPVQRTVWGMPVVETSAMAQGFALVGDFRRAVLFDREQASISVGTVGDDFIRNIVRVLAEMRAGFGVLRPLAFCNVDLVA
jgi:HK97 family phage major capsid protein